VEGAGVEEKGEGVERAKGKGKRRRKSGEVHGATLSQMVTYLVCD